MGRKVCSRGFCLSRDPVKRLEHDQKRALFRRCFAALDPGGAFVNADQVAGATPALTQQLHDRWRHQAHQAGVTEAELAEAERRMSADRLAPLEDQLAWLREAGFQDVDCWYRDGMFAVYAGYRR